MQTALVITAVAQSLLALCTQAVTLPFEKDSEPFYSSKLKITWAATNQLPSSIRIFKTHPAKFTQAAVSNLTAMGGAPMPKQGMMYLYKPISSRRPHTNVPDETRAFELGTNILEKLGFPADGFISEADKLRAWYYPGKTTYFDKATRERTTERSVMGIEFRRALDGIICYGQRVHIQFEKEEAVTQLEARWCDLEPTKTCVMASVDEMVSWIREGRARVHSLETTGTRWVKVSDIKNILITDARLQYTAFSDFDTDMPPDYVYPFAILTVEAELGPDDKEQFSICCPVIKEALSGRSRKNGEFGVHPSRLFEKQRQKEGGA